jgi:hypothetical protein
MWLLDDDEYAGWWKTTICGKMRQVSVLACIPYIHTYSLLVDENAGWWKTTMCGRSGE